MFSLLLGGCSSKSYLPSAKETVISPWDSFAEVQGSFDKITPFQTNLDTLKQLGFAPAVIPNIQILNHLDIMQRFMPNPSITIKDLDAGLRECLAAREHCQAFEIVLHKKSSDRHGNVLLDLLNFRRQTSNTGWEFKAIIVMKDELTVYKICGGKPNINEALDQKNPLGPLHSLDNGFIWDAAPW
jgi:hypothetical protein